MEEFFLAVNEIFYSLQGEGKRAGEPSFFIRLQGCNLQCSRYNEAGFDCDTEFLSGKRMSFDQILANLKELSAECKWIIFTGGEPSLQLIKEEGRAICHKFTTEKYKLAIETNGTNELPQFLFDHICVSPKTAEHTIRQKTAHEIKYVRRVGQEIPKPVCQAERKYLSPAWDAHGFNRENLDHCVDAAAQNLENKMTQNINQRWGMGENPLYIKSKEGISDLLKLLGEDPEREGLQDTPARFIRAMKEMTEGYQQDPKQILSKVFDSKIGNTFYDEIIIVPNIEFISLCEHHLLPFKGVAHVGYIPKEGRIVGLSKIPRLVDCFAKRLQVQEKLTMEIANSLYENLEALGVGVVIKAHHSCMSCRGVKKSKAKMVTSCLLGAMRQEARTEFLHLIK